MSDIKITGDFKKALDLIEKTDKHIFLTGRAGTGKSTLLSHFRKNTKKKAAILAPTGVAALNVKGQTIHSFFGFHPDIHSSLVKKARPDQLPLFKNLETIVIDEISMVRADLLDCIDRALRINRDRPEEPFGGVQMIFIGDLYQLPPVVTKEDQYRFETEYNSPYFFSSYVMTQIELEKVELKKVHRQKEKSFVDLLEKIRTKTVGPKEFTRLKKLHDPHFDPGEDNEYIHLTTTNKAADIRNQYELKKLPGKEYKLKASSEGELPDRRMPSESTITVKEGARIMFTINDPEKRFVNGTLGTIEKISAIGFSKTPTLRIRLDNGEKVELKQHTWEVFEYRPGEHASLQESIVGRYTQYPITLAWAITIHKAQGKTFDKVLIDLGWGAFAHGQTYVALSRATTENGLVLLKPLRPKDIIHDQVVSDFLAILD